jgi:hypothetical protein
MMSTAAAAATAAGMGVAPAAPGGGGAPGAVGAGLGSSLLAPTSSALPAPLPAGGGKDKKKDKNAPPIPPSIATADGRLYPTSPDVLEILSFSCIMLNTDAHNPSIKREKKMTRKQFVANNRYAPAWC